MNRMTAKLGVLKMIQASIGHNKELGDVGEWTDIHTTHISFSHLIFAQA